LTLVRLEDTNQGTFGIIFNDSDNWWNSLELPYRDNKPNISCIPIGNYKVSMRYSNHFKRELYHVLGVQGRSYIMIHPANLAGDEALGYQTQLQGCITLGKKLGVITNKFGKKQRCVLNSGIAIREFMLYLDNKDFNLRIVNGFSNQYL